MESASFDHESALAYLISQWQRRRAEGVGVSPAELCRERPELLPALECRITDALDTILQVISDEPVPPRQLQSMVPRDLETIGLKCLQKQPGQRYASAAELANELQRYLAGRPIQARPVSRWERGWRWCRRNPMAASFLREAKELIEKTKGGSDKNPAPPK